MEIKERYGQRPVEYADRMKAEQVQAKETESRTPDLRDEYISSEKSDTKPSGLYRLGQDEAGRKKVFFDDPKKAGQPQPVAEPDHQKKPAEKCTGNTDAVDREIRELKEKKKELEQQLKSASGDERQVRELESRLAQVESELSQKDNDTYRRQHSTFV